MMNHSTFTQCSCFMIQFDPGVGSYKLQVDPIKDHYFDPFQYHLTEIFDPIFDQAF